MWRFSSPDSQGSSTPAQATGTISLSYSGDDAVRESAGPSRVQPMLVGSSITLPNGYKASFVASTNCLGNAGYKVIATVAHSSFA